MAAAQLPPDAYEVAALCTRSTMLVAIVRRVPHESVSLVARRIPRLANISWSRRLERGDTRVHGAHELPPPGVASTVDVRQCLTAD
jgi:hypothetical protein